MVNEGGLLPGPLFAGGYLIKNENLRSRERISWELLQPRRHSWSAEEPLVWQTGETSDSGSPPPESGSSREVSGTSQHNLRGWATFPPPLCF